MIYLELFLGFLKVGCFSFGGAYAAIPLIRDVVLSYGWLDDEMVSYMVAVSESTPGPIMVNMATYVGASQAGFLGALIATFAVVLPAFIIILLVTAILNKVIQNKFVNATIQGINPCIIGIILATGCFMMVKNVLGNDFLSFDLRSFLITLFLSILYFGSKKFWKKEMSPILLIGISAVIGMVAFSF